MDNRKCNLDFDFTPIGQAIKKARNTEHMTRENLAELLDYSVRHVQSIENDGQFPSIQLLFFLARRFHISLDQFTVTDVKSPIISEVFSIDYCVYLKVSFFIPPDFFTLILPFTVLFLIQNTE